MSAPQTIESAAIAAQALRQIEACADSGALNVLRVKYLGRKGLLQDLMSKIPGLPVEQRKNYGAAVNDLKNKLAVWLSEKETALAAGGPRDTGLDATLPGKRPLLGRLHPVTQVKDQICDIFYGLGFKIFEGPEIETEYNNFAALNIPLEHPSRDAFDTFYLKLAGEPVSQLPVNPKKNQQATTGKPANRQTGKLLLRSHTSPAQIRAMQAFGPPLAVIVPGRVYRPDAVDASHSFMFHQLEGFAVDQGLRFSDLKGILFAFARQMFGEETKMRFRPSFFPFTEPSAEVDVSCIICRGRGCAVCKRSGWLEILGCGMIHPHVFKSVGYDAKKWRGFAFGMGVERIAMLKFGISDIRLFFENDMRFLEQF